MDGDWGANDAFGGEVNATVSGVTVTTGYMGIPDSAYQFSASSYVRHENTNGELLANDGFTVSLWLDEESGGSQKSLVQFLNKADSSIVNFQLDYDSGGRVIFKCENQPSFDVNFHWGSPRTMDYKRMRHIAMAYDWSTNLMTFYYEGDYRGQRELPEDCLIQTDGPLRIGGLSSYEYDGKMACFQMFNKALNQREIIQTSRCPIKEIKPSIYVPGDTENWVKDYSGISPPDAAMHPVSTYWFSGPYGSTEIHAAYGTATSGLTTSSNDYFPHPIPQNFVEDFTLMTFVYLKTANKEMHVIVVESSTYSNIVVGVSSGNQFYASIKCTSGGTTYTISGGTFVVDTWFHIALVRVKSTSSMFLYVNGVEAAQTTSGPSCTLETTTDIHIMRDSYHTSDTEGATACFIGYEQALPNHFIHSSVETCPNNPRISTSFCEGELTQYNGLWSFDIASSGAIYFDLSNGKIPDNDIAGTAYFGLSYAFEVQLRAIGTKGHADNDYWVTSYKLEYYLSLKFDGPHSTFYKDVDGSDKIFTGNSDRNTPVYHRFHPTLRGFFFKIYPLTWNNRPGVRLSLVGCPINAFSCEGALHYQYQGYPAYIASAGNVNNLGTDYTYISYDDDSNVWTHTPTGDNDEELWLQHSLGYLAKVTKVPFWISFSLVKIVLLTFSMFR